MVACRDLSYAVLAGSRGIVAAQARLSSEMQANELSLAGLYERSVQRVGRHLVAGRRLPVHLHPALVDLAPPVARGLAEDRIGPSGRLGQHELYQRGEREKCRFRIDL